jgi:hypothetical protein
MGGGVLDLVQHIIGCGRGAALRWLADFFGLPLDDRPITATERRQYARRNAHAGREARALVAWKARLVDALRKERNRWWEVYHAARKYIRYHGLDSELGAGLADIYEAAEAHLELLNSRIDLMDEASYSQLLPIFRDQRGRAAA